MSANDTPVTVVVTCYNREKYLAAAIESVLGSRFTDFALLVLDDASTDGSVSIARHFAQNDTRIRVVVNDKNLGDYQNRNRALELVETPYLKYHDSDDLMYPHCLEIALSILESEPTAGFALSSGRAWSGGPCPMLLTPRMAYAREFLGEGLFQCGPAGALFRTEFLRRVGGFPSCGVASDYAFWLDACALTNVLLLPADLFWYRRHLGQEFAKPEARRDYARVQARAWVKLFSPGCPLHPQETTLARKLYARRMLKMTLRDARAGEWSILRLRLREARFGFLDFFKYFTTSSLDPTAGTPLDAQGDFLVPDWLRHGARSKRIS